MRVWPGESFPLGATWDGRGVNFSVFSRHAEAIELCLFDSFEPRRESARLSLTERTRHCWHAYLPDARPGQLYGYRAHGPWDPANGLRFNADKLLFDPYARSVARRTRWSDAMFGHVVGHPDGDLERDGRDSAPFAPLAEVIDPSFDWGDDRPPRTPWHRTLIYETHVRGLTMRHPDVPVGLRGTYAGLATEPVLRHLHDLGVTAVELLPVQHHVDDRPLVERGLVNYWGYNPLAWFAPDSRYASDDGPGAVVEFKAMVKTLHAAGLEVILDVVFNHTAEGDRTGPMLSLRGLDNVSYYRLADGDRRHGVDYTGCGNTVDLRTPEVLRLVMDSLRYWLTEMRVDGFRFDLATALGRESPDFDPFGGFFDAVAQDPVVSRAKLVAEPWDLGPGGYRVGDFPLPWSEWNGKYRDAVRSYWRGDGGRLGELATRVSGSSDLYSEDRRGPTAGINFVTSHDGFTLADLVSYERKHNEANGEKNGDGDSHNISQNCGVEGPTDDPAVLTLRRRLRRNMLATLLLSQGVPMLGGGDELGRTQGGNNNAYCQDNETSWHDWDLDDDGRAFLTFAMRMSAIRRAHPVLQRRHFFEGRPGADGLKDVEWLHPTGRPLSDADWKAPAARCLGALLTADTADEIDDEGSPCCGRTLLALLNAGAGPAGFRLPRAGVATRWRRLVDTRFEDGTGEDAPELAAGETYELAGRSVALLEPDGAENGENGP